MAKSPKNNPLTNGRSKPEVERADHSGTDGTLAWSKFVKDHPSYSEAGDDAIYALPIGLIDALEIATRGILDRKDFQLERDLANASGLGFVFRRPIVFRDLYELQGTGRVGSSITTDARHQAIDQRLREMEAVELDKAGRSGPEIKTYFVERKLLQAKITERGMGYCGWLATHAEFRNDRDRFREKWEGKIATLRRFPTYPVMDFAGKEPQVAKADREYYVDYLCLYRRWCIHTFATWDLPIPMRSDIVIPSMYSLSSVDEAGVTMFVPWHLLRNKDITLREIADQKGAPAAIRPWVDGKPKNWGPTRLMVLLEMHCYIELALKQRYFEKLRRKWTHVDDALSRYFQARSGKRNSDRDSFSETVKKARQELERRLKSSNQE